MLADLVPRAHNAHSSLLLFGPILDDFDDWLIAQGYRYSTRKGYLYRCTAIERYFLKRKQCDLAGLTTENFCECRRFYRHRPGGIAPIVTCLQRFLLSRQILSASELPCGWRNANSARKLPDGVAYGRGECVISTSAELIIHMAASKPPKVGQNTWQ